VMARQSVLFKRDVGRRVLNKMLKRFWNHTWKYIRDTELYFQLFDIKYPQVHFEGSCKMSGNCCRALMLGYRFRAIRTLKEFKKEKRTHPHYEMFVPSDKKYDDGFLRFRCSNLTENNTCAIHDTRPDLCRLYPDPEMIRYGGTLLPGCGYRIVPEKKFDDYLTEKLVSIDKVE